MLSANVLCLKKRKKKSYCLPKTTKYDLADKKNSSSGMANAMLHITEDTPPDMLAGAMDVIVHLPNNKSIKMSVERSTPMMDLLVQITTNNHLQLSNYTLQALGMAPSSNNTDKILPFKPNTPIGTLETQHIKVIPKMKTISKINSTGHQPFESTFRLKVHLPRNQLFVIRVNQNIQLKEIMKKVCNEKNLDPLKYEFRHPDNLDEILDPKLTLSDYQITQVHILSKSNSANLNHTFSTNDIMALRKEEERKQMHNKTGGGVFNLIFRRGKSSTGSLSSENRSISPIQSDESRSVTPPNVQQVVGKSLPIEKPKPPQRKRRPAPKPPILEDKPNKPDSNKLPDVPSCNNKSNTNTNNNSNNNNNLNKKNNLTICHSRNSSDSSGYHEASILSDNCNNTSLPRRPKSIMIDENHTTRMSNLPKLSTQSKSTSNLAIPSRKKKVAPLPPSVLKSSTSITNLENPSPIIASQSNIVEPLDNSKQVSKSPCALPVPLLRLTVNPKTCSNNDTEILNHEDTEVDIDEKSSLKVEKTFNSTSAIINSSDNDQSQSLKENNIKNDPNSNDLDSLTSSVDSFVSATNTFFYDQENIKTLKDSTFHLDTLHNLNDNLLTNKFNNINDSGIKENSLIKESVKTADDLNSNVKKENLSEKCIENVNDCKKNDPIVSNTDIIVNVISNEIENSNENSKVVIEDSNNELETEWKYLLPSPPKAFRDSSSEDCKNSNSPTTTPTISDSVVTSPELFEKLQVIKDEQLNEKETVVNGIVMDDYKPILNKLSLENLEKRKSLVYNRELATSLKRTDDVKIEKFPNLLEKNDKNFTNIKKSSLDNEMKISNQNQSTLPNFKITTYDNPKQKFNIFEDDTIRSNTELNNKKNLINNNIQNTNKIVVNNKSIEINNEDIIDGKKSNNYKFFRSKISNGLLSKNFYNTSNVFRSESFSSDTNWTPSKPVTRSKSQIALNKYKEDKLIHNENVKSLTKTGSLFDVSGLQSLEVIRLIQNKLNTPNNSMEHINEINNKNIEKKLDDNKYVQIKNGPSINMSTWSERPKIPVNVKDDPDYKYSNNVQNYTKLIVNSTSNDVVNNNNNNNLKVSNNSLHKSPSFTINSRNGIKLHVNDSVSNNFNININGSKNITTQNNGNVLIKIGSNSNSNQIYRKPFGNINKNDNTNRPHSICFGQDFDSSRIPVVRSVEFKRPYKDNTTITPINQNNNNNNEINNYKKLFIENNDSDNYNEKFEINKPVFRVNSFLNSTTTTISSSSSSSSLTTTTNNSSCYHQLHSFSTLPKKFNENINEDIEDSAITKTTTTTTTTTTKINDNKSMPFSQINLRRTESAKINSPLKSTQPPSILSQLKPKNNGIKMKPMDNCGNTKEQLLQAIREFGGKKGLRAVKA